MKAIIIIFIFLLIPVSVVFGFSFDVPLKQQIQSGLLKNEILCPDNSHILVERVNDKLACVFPLTAEKLGWEKVYDEETRENLWIHNIPEVKNCERKSDSVSIPDAEFGNSTHYFDLRSCIWIKN